MARHEIVNPHAANGLAPICGKGGVSIPVFQGKGRHWFLMGIFSVLICMHCISILDLLAIAPFEELDRNETGVEWFPFEYERAIFVYMPATPAMTHNCVDETKLTARGHDKIRPEYRQEFADRGISHEISECLWHWFLE